MTKILLVEDDKSLREIYGVRLLAEGYDIVSAGDGEEALAMAIKDRPDLIVSDVMMPKISGFDMLDILRSTTETKDIKVIMMTALSSEDQRQRGVALGADRYLVKSQVGIEDVVRTVHDVLGDAPTLAGSSSTAAAMPQRPAAMPQPSPAIAQQPVASAATAPQASPVAPASALPQPTAPFSTQRPVSLGDRVIHPLESNQNTDNISSLMDEELAKIGASTVPVQTMPTDADDSLLPAPTAPAPEPSVPTAPVATGMQPPLTPPLAPSTMPNSSPAPAVAFPAPSPVPVPSPVPPLQPVAPQFAPAPQPAPTAAPVPPLTFEETPRQAPQAPAPMPPLPPLPPMPGA